MAHGHEDIRAHVRTYMMVFGALMALTIITVAVSYLHLNTPAAISVALFIATIKGSLVALFFMHLSNEKKIIYALLVLTVAFAIFELYVPTWGQHATFGEHKPVIGEVQHVPQSVPPPVH
jgi:cytochrome c oxidase subunit IV